MSSLRIADIFIKVECICNIWILSSVMESLKNSKEYKILQ